jgi:enoyl-CoA hydratase/carnithine racemase
VTTIERAEGASVARIVLNRPQARNAITVALAEGLGDALRAAATQAQVIVIRGADGHSGGFELIQARDIAITRDDAVLADNHLNFAMIPGGGGSQRLPRIVGPQRALGLILSGDRLTGAQAEQWGLVYRSVPAADFERTVADLTANLAGKDTTALARAKRLVREGLRLPLRDGLALETETIIGHLGGERAGAGISRFTDRDPASGEVPASGGVHVTAGEPA